MLSCASTIVLFGSSWRDLLGEIGQVGQLLLEVRGAGKVYECYMHLELAGQGGRPRRGPRLGRGSELRKVRNLERHHISFGSIPPGRERLAP